MIPEFRPFLPGDQSIPAYELNRAMDEIVRLSHMTASPPLEIVRNSTGYHLRLASSSDNSNGNDSTVAIVSVESETTSGGYYPGHVQDQSGSSLANGAACHVWPLNNGVLALGYYNGIYLGPGTDGSPIYAVNCLVGIVRVNSSTPAVTSPYVAYPGYLQYVDSSGVFHDGPAIQVMAALASSAIRTDTGSSEPVCSSFGFPSNLFGTNTTLLYPALLMPISPGTTFGLGATYYVQDWSQPLLVKTVNPGTGDVATTSWFTTSLEANQTSGITITSDSGGTGTFTAATAIKFTLEDASYTHNGVVNLTNGQVLGFGSKQIGGQAIVQGDVNVPYLYGGTGILNTGAPSIWLRKPTWTSTAREGYITWEVLSSTSFSSYGTNQASITIGGITPQTPVPWPGDFNIQIIQVYDISGNPKLTVFYPTGSAGPGSGNVEAYGIPDSLNANVLIGKTGSIAFGTTATVTGGIVTALSSGGVDLGTF